MPTPSWPRRKNSKGWSWNNSNPDCLLPSRRQNRLVEFLSGNRLHVYPRLSVHILFACFEHACSCFSYSADLAARGRSRGVLKGHIGEAERVASTHTINHGGGFPSSMAEGKVARGPSCSRPMSSRSSRVDQDVEDLGMLRRCSISVGHDPDAFSDAEA